MLNRNRLLGRPWPGRDRAYVWPMVSRNGGAAPRCRVVGERRTVAKAGRLDPKAVIGAYQGIHHLRAERHLDDRHRNAGQQTALSQATAKSPIADARPTNRPTSAPLAGHGAAQLASVLVDTYNAELRDTEGFVGDRASKRAFQAIVDDWRERLRKVGEDPLGETPTDEISKKKLDKLLVDGDVEAAGLVHSAIEEFAQELAAVIRRFLRLKDWRGTQRIAVGGGLRASRIGELAIGRAAVLLKAETATRSSCGRSATIPTRRG